MRNPKIPLINFVNKLNSFYFFTFLSLEKTENYHLFLNQFFPGMLILVYNKISIKNMMFIK
jgi:hypothetical protein